VILRVLRELACGQLLGNRRLLGSSRLGPGGGLDLLVGDIGFEVGGGGVDEGHVAGQVERFAVRSKTPFATSPSASRRKSIAA